MLSNHLLSSCVGALALGLSTVGAVALPALSPSVPTDGAALELVRGAHGGGGGGGFHGGGGSGFHGGGFHGGFHGGGFVGHHFGHGFHGRGLGFYGPYAYDDDFEGNCWWSSRRDRWVCPSY